MRTTIELQRPNDPITYVEKHGRYYTYVYKGVIRLKNVSQDEAIHEYFADLKADKADK